MILFEKYLTPYFGVRRSTWSFPISFFHGFDLNVDHWTMSGGKSKQPDYNSVALSIQEDIDSLRPCQYFCEDSGHQLSNADAFSIQLAVRDIRKARGEHVAGFKVCVSSHGRREERV